MRSFTDELRSRLECPNIPGLDGVRAIAVLVVILYHLGFPGSPDGAHGVMAFFVLSGFLITWLLLKENCKYGNISLSGFYRRRVLRIFPAFYCFWLVSVATLLLEHQRVWWVSFISAFLYFSNYFYGVSGKSDPVVGMTWSLAVEEQFYLLWPLCFKRYRGDLRKLTYLLIGIISSISICRGCVSLLLEAPRNYLEYAFEMRLDHLLDGCLLAVLLKRGALTSFWRFACGSCFAPLITLLVLVGSLWIGRFFPFDYHHSVAFVVEPVLVAVLIVQIVFLSAHPLWSWINWPWIRYIGRISYPLYLYHGFVIGQVSLFWPSLRERWSFPAALLGSFALASASYFLIEKQFLKMKNQPIRKLAPDLRRYPPMTQ